MAHLRIQTASSSFPAAFSLTAPSSRPSRLYPSPDDMAISPTASPSTPPFFTNANIHSLPPTSLSAPRSHPVESDEELCELDDLADSFQSQLPSLTENMTSRFASSRRASSVSGAAGVAGMSGLQYSSPSRSSSSSSVSSFSIAEELGFYHQQQQCPRSVPSSVCLSPGAVAQPTSAPAPMASIQQTLAQNRMQKQMRNGSIMSDAGMLLRHRALSGLMDRALVEATGVTSDGVHPSCLGA